jgi:glutathione peroxidase
MLRRFVLAAVAAAIVTSTSATQGADKVSGPLSFKMNSLQGKEVDLSKYKGKVVLMVNVASQCGLTGQYTALQALHEKYGPQGLAVAGFPANEFGKQEPGTNDEIATFCKDNYGVTFDMYSKIVVKGEGIHPLYSYLTKDSKFTGDIGWNFEKFLIGRNGEVVARFKPNVEPDSPEVISAIEAELAKK